MVEVQTYKSEISPIDFYEENKLAYSCFIPRDNYSYIGLKASAFYYDLESLSLAMHDYPEEFFAGYFSYESMQSIEPLSLEAKPSLYPHHKALWFRYSEWLVVEKKDNLFLYKKYTTSALREGFLHPQAFVEIHAEIKKQDYVDKVKLILAEIAKGSYYQINYSFPIVLPFALESAWQMFKTYYQLNPANQFAFFDLGELQILSFSPENFFKIRQKHISVKPIKGTISTELDVKHLLESKKDEAELFMITDLFRNDLYRICSSESVKVNTPKAALKLKNLYHLYSEVSGELKPDISFKEIILALFPSGSISGCPKVRSQLEIHKLEETARGIYTGSIGFKYLDEINLNVAIRTAVYFEKNIFYNVGSGIVFDSMPDLEWEECQLKASAFREIYARFF